MESQPACGIQDKIKQLALDSLLEHIFAPEGAYSLFLAGSARSRAAETIRMALALWQHAIPFGLQQGAHLKRMATGEDWIGVVPHHFGLAPHSCEEFFPKADQIHDFMSFLSLTDYPGLEQWIEWYPLERIRLV